MNNQDNNQWININDRLPEVGQSISFVNDISKNPQDKAMHELLKRKSPIKSVRFGFVYEVGISPNYIQTGVTEEYNSVNGHNGIGDHITHWQPLPEPPLATKGE